jgi:hypothetical protein
MTELMNDSSNDSSDPVLREAWRFNVWKLYRTTAGFPNSQLAVSKIIPFQRNGLVLWKWPSARPLKIYTSREIGPVNTTEYL